MVVDSLYGDERDSVGGSFRFDDDVLKRAFKRIYEREFNPMTEIEQNLFNEIWSTLNLATDKGFGKRVSTDPGFAFYNELKHNNAVFSAFKVHRMQNDMAALLVDSKGRLKPFERWLKEVQPIAGHQVKRWLRTEYDTAVLRAHQAADWIQFEEEKDVLPNLEWMSSTSANPGADHQIYWGVILPVEHSFWDIHRPGDRWNCKCSLHSTDKPATDGSIPPAGTGEKPSPGLDNNPGKDARIFSSSHPYFRHAYQGAEEAVEKLMLKLEVKEQRKRIKQWATENLVSTRMWVPGMNTEIGFNVSGIKEALNQPHKYLKEKNDALLKMPDLLRKAEYVRFDPDTKGNPMVKGYHYLKVRIAEEDSYIVVRELENGKRYFYTIVERIKER